MARQSRCGLRGARPSVRTLSLIDCYNGTGYDTVLLGQVEPPKIDVDAIQARLMRPEYARVAQLLRASHTATGGRSLLESTGYTSPRLPG